MLVFQKTVFLVFCKSHTIWKTLFPLFAVICFKKTTPNESKLPCTGKSFRRRYVGESRNGHRQKVGFDGFLKEQHQKLVGTL